MAKPSAPPRAKPVSAKTQALLDAMKQDVPTATPDQLSVIHRKVAELRDLELETSRLAERGVQISQRRKELTDKELVDVMDAAHVPSITIAAIGNMPEFTVEIGAYYHANIRTDWPEPQRQKAFAWILKHHDGMLRNTFTVDFGKNSVKVQKELTAWLTKRKVKYVNEFGVPWNTLTSFVKEQIEEHKKTPPLALLGATVGRVAKIKKEKK